MANKIILKKSSVVGKVPTITDLAYGEVALNYADGKLYYKNADNVIGRLDSLAIGEVTGEPMGFPNRTDSVLSFDNSTRTFTIAPASTSFHIYNKGNKFTFTTAQSVVIPNTTGLYYLSFNTSGTLQYTTSFFNFETETMTAYVYWNATNSTASFVADERHGITLDWQTHEYLHRTRGAALASGFSISNYTIIGNGSLDSHAQIDLSGGTFFDEDLQVDITHSNTPTANTWQQDLQGPAKIPIFYLNGNNEWVLDTPTDFPLKMGTSRPRYNVFSGGVWSTADVDNNKYATTWILATNNINYPIIGIIGQSQNDSLGDAEAIAFSSLTLPNFPVVELRPLYKLIFKATDAATNVPHAILNSVLDLRSLSSIPSTTAVNASDHGNLSGLGDDDHLQYVHTTNARTISANHQFSGNITFSGTVNLPDQVGLVGASYGSATAIPVITVNTDGLITAISTASISTTLTIAGDNSGSDTISLASDTLTIAGGTALTSVRADNSITLNLDDTTVAPGSYGSTTSIPSFTVDAQGRLTAAQGNAITYATGISYNSSTGVVSLAKSDSTSATIDIGVGSGDSPTFTDLTLSGGNANIKDTLISSSTITTTATTTGQVLVSLDATIYRSAEFIIQASNANTGRMHLVKVLSIHNGTTADYTEYGSVFMLGLLGTFSVDYDSSLLRLLVTPSLASSTVFKITTIATKI